MQKRWLFVLVMIVSVLAIPTLAQDTTPPAVRDAAINAAEAELGSRPSGWSYSILQPTDDSNLGCLLVTGTTMAQSVTPYRVSLTYPNGTYIVHVTADGSMVQLCDTKFGTGVGTPAPTPTGGATTTCTASPVATLPVYGAPSTAVPAIASLQASTEYAVIGQSNSSTWVQIVDNGVVGWVEASSVILSSPCNAGVDVTGHVDVNFQGGDCFVAPLAAFSNVRATPDLDGQLVAQIYENSIFQTTATDTSGTWYYMAAGWVSNTVISTYGECDSLPTDMSLVGTGFADTGTTASGTPASPTALSVTDALTRHACPLDFAGYMQPRVTRGAGTASIGQGGLPNTLRSFPDTDDNIGQRLGTIQPGRTIDRIIDGPACNDGYVWWYVEHDGAFGWTAESDSVSNDYYMEPTGATAAATPVTTGNISTSASATTITLDEGTAVGRITFGADTVQLYGTGTQPGFGGSNAGFFGLWDFSNQGNVNFSKIDMPSVATGLQYLDSINAFVVGDENGTVTIYNAASAAVIQQLTNLYARSDQFIPQYQVTPSGNAIVLTRCAAADCTSFQLASIDVATGVERWVQNLGTENIRALDISADETLVAIANDNGIWFYNVLNGQSTGVYQDAGLSLNTIAFNPADSNRLILGGCNAGGFTCSEGRIGLVDTSSATLLGVVPSQGAEIWNIAFTPDGTRFVTASVGLDVILYNSVTGTELGRYQVTEMIGGIDIANDNSTMAVSTLDGKLHFFVIAAP